MNDRIRIDTQTGATTVVEVNGLDIASAVTGADIRLEAGRFPEVRLELAVVTSIYFNRVEISIPDETRQALIQLGWTPPSAS